MLPTIYSGLSEDDRFIGKLLAAQNFMCNIQTEVTKLIQDYMKIRQKDRKRKQKQRKNPVKPPQQQQNTTPKIGMILYCQICSVQRDFNKSTKSLQTFNKISKFLCYGTGAILGETEMLAL